ncbi:MAG TPA: hypothetical protein DEB39_10515 [Planctomycetaceae bacterium]|nr:hypothetical protein [Planctomycetaceae bacterium]
MKTTFTREGILYLATVVLIFAGAALREVNLLLLLASFLCCPMIIAWRLGRRELQCADIRRGIPRSVHAGKMFIVSFELINTGSRYGLWSLVVEDTLVFLRDGERPSLPMRPAVYFEYLRPGERRKKTYAGILPQRGKYRIGPVTVSTRFPFGLFRTRRNLSGFGAAAENSADKTVDLTVFPRLGKLSTRWMARRHEAMESRHRRRFQPSRSGGEFLGLRDWRHGDLRRWIHWRASARHRSPVIRQFEQHQNHDATVLLDLYEPEPPTLPQRENIELAVSLTATLLSEMARQTATNLTLGFHGDRSDLLSGPTCTPLIDTMFETLATLEPSREDRLAEILLRAVGRIDSRGDIFLVTTRPCDIPDSPRLKSLAADPRFRAFASRIRVIDTSDKAIDEFFTTEEPE